MNLSQISRKAFFALMVLMVSMSGSGVAQADRAQGGECHIVVASDLHYLSPALTDYGEAFMEILQAADGKVTHYTPQIVSAFVAQTLAQRPDAVILCGDLTLNGAPQSHSELKDLLRPLREAGIRVLLIPGNHDIGPRAFRFGEDGATGIEGTTPDQFVRIYEDFGWGDAVSRDETSLSYLAELSADLYVLMIDVNTGGANGVIQEGTLAWAQEQLRWVKGKGAKAFAVSHQNLFAHNPMFRAGFQIGGAKRLQALYHKAGLCLHLSGHMHLQHIAREDGMTEIASSSLAVAPNQYGELHIDAEGRARYATRSVDVAAWAKAAQQSDRNLLAFSVYAREFFDQTTGRQAAAQLSDVQADAQEKKRMHDFAVALNAQYFSGTRDEEADRDALRLWERYRPQAFFTAYLMSIAAQTPEDMNHLSDVCIWNP